MLETYAESEIAKAAGWPEWEIDTPGWMDERTEKVGIIFHRGRWYHYAYLDLKRCISQTAMTNHEALCVLREWLRKKLLLEHGVQVVWVDVNLCVVQKFNGGWLAENGHWVATEACRLEFRDEDVALCMTACRLPLVVPARLRYTSR
jgi:hypothetical protein